MAVYTFGVTTTVIDRHIAFASIDNSSEPNLTALGELIDYRAAQLGVAIYDALSVAASSITTSTDEDLYTACQGAIVDIVSAEWIARNKREDPETGLGATAGAMARWRAFLDDIRQNRSGKTSPAHVESQISTPATTEYGGFWKRGMQL